jgi:hypothetical protein
MHLKTHLVFEEIFDQIEKCGLILPLSYLGDEKAVDDLIDELLNDLDPVEAISYSSFLNMVVQTCESEESEQLGRKEVAGVGFKKDVGSDKVFFHRDGLLHMMARIIMGCKDGKIRITGGSDRRGTIKYYKALLLINSKLNATRENYRNTLLKNYIIRDYPPTYSFNTTNIIYKNRLQRYWYIYNQILPQMELHAGEILSKGINVLEKKSGLTLREHYSVLADVLNWFLILPLKKMEKQNIENAVLGFDYRNIDSFYIRKKNFPDPNRFIQLITLLAQDKNDLQKYFVKNRRDEVKGFYKYFRDFFDRPVFKIDDSTFCILDLKFLIENLCSGLLWRINNIISWKDGLQELKGYYGNLIEKYFVFLLNNIFKKDFKCSDGGPDYIVETDGFLLIFEFTTEYYRLSSLYDAPIKSFMDDLHRLLFNSGEDDKCGRFKKDKGKFSKLNEYLNTISKQKKVIPILVTENYLGDYDLLNQFDDFLDKKIQENGLTNLQKSKPIILSLDDLEIFWALNNENQAIQEIKTSIESWEKSDKGKFLYNFSYFLSSASDAIIKNEHYTEFFNYSNFLMSLEIKNDSTPSSQLIFDK